MIATANIDEAAIVGDFRTEPGYARHQILDAFKHRRPLQRQRPAHKLRESPSERVAGYTLQDVDHEHITDVRVRPTVSGCEKHSRRHDGVEKFVPRPRSMRVPP